MNYRKTLVLFTSLLLLMFSGISFHTSTRGQQDQPKVLSGQPDTLKVLNVDTPLPWHLVDIDWQEFHTNEKHTEPFLVSRLTVDIAILSELRVDSPYFLCPFNSAIAGHSFYSGFTTARNHNSPKTPYLKPEIKLEQSVIFRRWRDLDYTAILPAVSDGLCAGKWEDDFISAETPYKWSRGLYTVEYSEMYSEYVRGRSHRWVAMFVYSHALQTRTFIGALRFPFERLAIIRQLFTSFVEVYARPQQKAERFTIPPLRVGFGNIIINGDKHEPLAITAYYPREVPQIAKAMMATDYLKDYPDDRALLRAPATSVVVIVGKDSLTHRTEKEVLYENKKSHLTPVILDRDQIEALFKDQYSRPKR